MSAYAVDPIHAFYANAVAATHFVVSPASKNVDRKTYWRDRFVQRYELGI